MPSSAPEIIATVERARAALISDVQSLTDEQATFRPSADSWSVVENVEHLFLAEISGTSKIWAAVASYRHGGAWTDALPHRGKSVEQIVAETWKDKEVAPPIATPHIGGPLAYWCTSLASLSMVLERTGHELDGVDLAAVVFPHFLSGSMDARQRLEFLRFHIERHHAQIQRVMAHPDFPVTIARS